MATRPVSPVFYAGARYTMMNVKRNPEKRKVMGTKAITAAALTKYYGKARGIDGLNLEVETGDFFGFIGPNGAGKSTTIRTLLGLISPTSGKAQVLGLDIEKDSRAILQRVGYLPSDTAFYNGMKVREILKISRFSLYRKLRKIKKTLASAQEGTHES